MANAMDYIQASQATESARSEVERLAAMGDALKNWRTTTLANTPIDSQADFPMSKGARLDMHEWPDAAKVTQAFANYYNAKRTLESIWNGLDPIEQKTLQPPEKFY